MRKGAEGKKDRENEAREGEEVGRGGGKGHKGKKLQLYQTVLACPCRYGST